MPIDVRKIAVTVMCKSRRLVIKHICYYKKICFMFGLVTSIIQNVGKRYF